MRTKNSAMWLFRIALACFGLLSCLQARADITDPATLHIGPGAGTACATGGCPLLNGELNSIGSGGTVDIYQNSSGAATLDQPVFLILAIPNNTTNLFASNPISSVQFINSYPGGTTTNGTSSFATAGKYNLKSPAVPNTGFFGSMTSSDIYTFLQVQQPADNSNNFGNLSGYDASINGITATSFGMYVFALSGGSLAANGLINVTFNSGSIPLGTFAVAYGMSCSEYTNGVCTTGKVYDTPFTEAGLTTGNHKVPEPGTFVLLGLALPMLAWMSRRTKGRRVLVQL